MVGGQLGRWEVGVTVRRWPFVFAIVVGTRNAVEAASRRPEGAGGSGRRKRRAVN